MSRENRIVWTEGMFLVPQHFQQWDRYSQGELKFRQNTFSPHAWGVCSAEFDLEALGNQRLKLEQVEAVMPDGSLVRAPAIDPIPPGRQFTENFSANLHRLDVFLAVPDHRPGVPECRPSGQGGVVESRFQSDPVKIDDLNNPGKEMEIMVGRQNLKLLVSGENLDGYICLKLAEIERSSSGEYRIANDYAPPALSISACGPLPDLLGSLTEALIAKSKALASQTRQRGEGMVEFGTSDVGTFWLLHTVNSFMPLLMDHRRTPGRHPRQVYATMAQLAGGLCTFGVDRDPSDIPEYDHAALGRTFTELTALIRSLLETVMPSRFSAVSLTSRDETMLTGNIVDKGLLEGKSTWYLSVRGEMPTDKVRVEVPSQTIIGSPHNIDFLVRTATPGVGLTHVPVPPRDFPLKAGCTYFSVDTSCETWETIRESRAIAIYLGGPGLRECSFELITMK
jgi:type VI secretion system protein ImpJ